MAEIQVDHQAVCDAHPGLADCYGAESDFQSQNGSGEDRDLGTSPVDYFGKALTGFSDLEEMCGNGRAFPMFHI